MTAIQHLVKHLVTTNLKEIASLSFRHLHTRNVHSIMLVKSPNASIRLYIAVPGHTLHHNYQSISSDKVPMSVGFHAHSSDITLVVTRGELLNWTVDRTDNDGFALTEYSFDSSLKGGWGFDYKAPVRVTTTSMDWLIRDHAVHLKSKVFHTVACPEDKYTAWLVYDGPEEGVYDKSCFSNADLTKWTRDGLYLPMSQAEVRRLLNEAHLLF